MLNKNRKNKNKLNKILNNFCNQIEMNAIVNKNLRNLKQKLGIRIINHEIAKLNQRIKEIIRIIRLVKTLALNLDYSNKK